MYIKFSHIINPRNSVAITIWFPSTQFSGKPNIIAPYLAVHFSEHDKHYRDEFLMHDMVSETAVIFIKCDSIDFCSLVLFGLGPSNYVSTII